MPCPGARSRFLCTRGGTVPRDVPRDVRVPIGGGVRRASMSSRRAEETPRTGSESRFPCGFSVDSRGDGAKLRRQFAGGAARWPWPGEPSPLELVHPMAAKKNKKTSGDLIISKSRTKAAVKKSNVSSDFYGALDSAVRVMIAGAEKRAQANGRKTLRPQDL